MTVTISARYLIAAILALALPHAASAQIDGAGGERLQVQLKFPESKAAFKGAEPIAIDFVLTNPTSEKVSVLVWRTPFGKQGITADIFDVAGGRTVATDSRSLIGYIGPVIKRRPPGPEDYITLAPGESRTTTVNLAKYYSIYQQGDYSVTYRAADTAIPIASDTPSVGPLRKMAAASNAVSFSVTESRAPAPRRASAALAAGTGPTFDQCDGTQQTDLKKALPEAQKIAEVALQILNGTAPGDQPNARRYKTWFGAHTAGRYSRVSSNYEKIAEAFRSKPIELACKGPECDPGTFAYVFPNDPYKIYVCGAFWAANITGTDSRAGTLVHEMSHFTLVSDTDDLAYGQERARQLAIQFPDRAVNNADSHEYFAENEPDLPM